MKKRAVLLVFLISLSTFAQKQNNETNKTEINQSTNFNFQRTIQLDEHKKNEEIIIKIEKQTKKFELMNDTTVTSGKLTTEIHFIIKENCNYHEKKSKTQIVDNSIFDIIFKRIWTKLE